MELYVHFYFSFAMIVFAIGSSKYRLYELILAKVELDEWSANINSFFSLLFEI